LEKHGGNIPNLLRAENPENRMGQYSKSFDEGWESRKLFCPVQLMLGLESNGLLKFREKRKVRQALGKGEKERSDKLFHFTFWCCLKLLFPLGGTSRSSFGKYSGWWSCRSWVRVRLDSRFPQGFSPHFLLQVLQRLPHAWMRHNG
jgi:hypothetical protein